MKKLFLYLTLYILIINIVSGALVDSQSAYYNGSLDASNIFDMLGINNGGTNNGVTNTSGIIGDGMNFDGSTDYIDMSTQNFYPTNADFSYNLWVYPTKVNCETPDGRCDVISMRDERKEILTISDPTTSNWGFWDGAFTNIGSAKINTWQMMTVVYNTTSFNHYDIYMNGTFMIQRNTTSSVGGGDFSIGVASGLSAAKFQGKIDELGFWNKSLSASEITELYNSGTGLQYPYATATASEITLKAKDWINNSYINIFGTYINGVWYNTSNGTINTGHYDNETTLYNLTYVATGMNNRTYNDLNWSNGNHEGILTQTTNIFVNFYAKDENNESLTNVYYNISTSTTNQENLGNPTQINLLNFINETSTTLNITINIEDRGNLYQDKTTTYIINRTTREVNTSLDPNELVLYFYDKDGNPTSVYGELTNEGYSANFTDDNFTFVQQNLSIGYVYIKLTTNSSKPFTQFYEYYNDYSNHIIQNITILTENTLTNFSIKVIGNTQNPLKEALVEANIVNPNGLVLSENLFIGQRYTNTEGYTNLYMGNKDISFDISKDGYTTLVTKTYSPVDMIPYLTNNPLELALSGGGITQTKGLTIIIPQYTRNKSINVPIYIHSPISTDIEVRTTYMINNGITKRGLSETINNDIYYTLLESGTHFDSGTGNITIEIYKDDTYHSTHTIIDKSTETTTNLFEKPTGIDTDVLLIILIIGVILASGFIGTQFDYEDAGIFGFYALSLIFVLIDNTFIWVITIPAIIMIAKKLMGLGGISE